MPEPILASVAEIEARVAAALSTAGASSESAAAATRAMMHATRLGVDSHGVRLTEHYTHALHGGRVNRTPNVTVTRTGPATGTVDGDDALGHLTSYRGMQLAIEIARESGVGAVGAVRSSHFGAAGAYAIAAAEAGLVGFATTNADSLVAPFQGTRSFHGTNPLAFAAPLAGSDPWLLDMATSSIPLNRVLLYRSLGRLLPEGVAADAEGIMTQDPHASAMLMPLGGEDFGFKGAALAGVATLFSAILTGAVADPDMLRMSNTTDFSTPRRMGHFFIAIDPERYVTREVFDTGLRGYLAALRAVPSTTPGQSTLAPGDREWQVQRDRLAHGVPLDPDTARFLGF